LGFLLVAVALVLGSARGVAAQISASDKATAEALFDSGLALMRDNKFEEACQKLEQSQAIERGIGTMLYLGECYEKLGRTASAWALFREASSAARAQGESERAQAGASRADQLESKLSHVVVQVPPENAVAGFELLRDGVALPSGLWGMPVPVDPGEHKFEARAPARAPWSGTAIVGPDAASVTVNVPVLAAAPELPSPAPEPIATPAEAAAAAAAASAAAHDHGNSGWTTQRTAAVVVGGVGVAALVIGSYFGIRAIVKNNDAKDNCPNEKCNPAGANADKSAHSAARFANVFVIGGALLTGAGVALYLISPREQEHVAVSVSADARGAQLAVGGAL
jgi:serine/threonine-protein kinase